MRAIRVHEIGGPEVLRYEEVPAPAPGPKDALIRVEATGVNYIDIYYRTGQYGGALPYIPGFEAAGVVEAVGAEVTEVKVGDRVAYSGVHGAYAGYTVVPAWRLLTLPQGVDARTGAAVVLQGVTAHSLSHSTYPLKPGDTALVHAAAGGVGLLLVQMAKMRGARVIGTVSTEEKAALARQAGADEVILYTTQDFAAEARRLTGGRGVQVVYDSVGKATFDASLDALAVRGYMVLCGQASGAVPPFDPQMLNAKGSLFLTRPTIGHYTATREELLQRATDIFNWIVAGRLKVHIGGTFPLKDAAEAHRRLEGRQTVGKILLIP